MAALPRNLYDAPLGTIVGVEDSLRGKRTNEVGFVVGRKSNWGSLGPRLKVTFADGGSSWYAPKNLGYCTVPRHQHQIQVIYDGDAFKEWDTKRRARIWRRSQGLHVDF